MCEAIETTTRFVKIHILTGRLLSQYADVFQEKINYVLVVGTSIEVILIGVSATPNARNAYDIRMFDAKMAVNTKGLDVSVIEGSKSGRIFFAGRSDNEVYEFTYKVCKKLVEL